MADIKPEALVAPTQVNGTSSTPTQNILAPSAGYPEFVCPPTLPRPPFIDISGIPNFRSLGGYLSTNGNTIVRPNLYYRCAHPTQVTPKGLNQLTTDLQIKAIYDLRSGPEVERTTASALAAATSPNATAIADAVLSTGHCDTTQPLGPPLTIPSATPPFQSLRHFTPVYATEDTGPDALARKLAWYTSPSDTTPSLPYAYSEGFVNAYRDIATHGVQAYTTIFRHILTRPSDAFIFHCTAGKDRTGIFAALLLRLAGVSDDVIAWEYAITEPGLGDWRTVFMNRMTGGMGLHGKAADPTAEPMTRARAARVCGSRAGNIRAWLEIVLDGEFGGEEMYLVKKCGFTPDEVEVIKRNIVVGLEEVGEGAVVRPSAIEGWTMDGGCEDV